jgi:hypothetical protein
MTKSITHIDLVHIQADLLSPRPGLPRIRLDLLHIRINMLQFNEQLAMEEFRRESADEGGRCWFWGLVLLADSR